MHIMVDGYNDHFSGPGKTIGPVCFCLPVTVMSLDS